MPTDNLQKNAKRFVGKVAEWVPPRGMRLLPAMESCPAKPFPLQWWIDGKRKTRNFQTETQRVEFAKGLIEDSRNIGKAAYRLDESEARAWQAFRAIVGDADLKDVAACWARHGGVKTTLTVNAGVMQFLAAKTAEGIDSATLANYRAVLDRFKETFGPVNVASIETRAVTDWVNGLKWKPYTVRTHLIRTRGFFTWLKTNRIISMSPCEGIKPPVIIRDEVKVLSVAEGKALFAWLVKRNKCELAGRMALEAFCGVRFSSAAQVAADDILFAERGIVLPAASIKTRRREYIDGLPENLWAWLEWSNPKTWTMNERQFLEAKSHAFDTSEVPHPHNALRHSFATYHVAANKDTARTAVILCHTSPTMLWQHYKGRATEADGKAWFEIMPTL